MVYLIYGLVAEGWTVDVYRAWEDGILQLAVSVRVDDVEVLLTSNQVVQAVRWWPESGIFPKVLPPKPKSPTPAPTLPYLGQQNRTSEAKNSVWQKLQMISLYPK